MPKGTIGQVILVANLNTFGIVTLAPPNQLKNALKTCMPTGTIGPLCVCLQEQLVQCVCLQEHMVPIDEEMLCKC